MKKIYFLILLIFLISIGCNDDNEEEKVDPVVEAKPSTAEPTDLFIVNMTMGNKEVAISHGKKVTLMGNSNYNLGDNAIISVMGANFNTDKSFPTEAKDMPKVNNSSEVRNNHVISFTIVDEANANAKLTVDKSFAFTNSGLNLWGDSYAKINAGGFTIKALDSYLNDATPPLGKMKNGNANTLIKFSDVAITVRDYSNSSIKFRADSNPDITATEWDNMLKEQGKEIFIKVIEGAIDAGEGKSQFYQPPL